MKSYLLERNACSRIDLHLADAGWPFSTTLDMAQLSSSQIRQHATPSTRWFSSAQLLMKRCQFVINSSQDDFNFFSIEINPQSILTLGAIYGSIRCQLKRILNWAQINSWSTEINSWSTEVNVQSTVVNSQLSQMWGNSRPPPPAPSLPGFLENPRTS